MQTRRVIEQVGEERRFQLLVGAVTDYAIYLLDPDGYISSWNAGAARIKGYTGDEVIGRHYSMFFTEEDREAGRPSLGLATALRTGRFESEGWRLRKDGSRFWAHAVLDAVRDENGRLIGFAKITRDMTERRAAQEAVRESERRFRLLVDSVADYAIFMLDRDGRVANWNKGAERITGYSAAEIVGLPYETIYTEEDRAAGLPARALETAATVGRNEAEGWRRRKDGTRFWAHAVLDAIRDEAGELIGFAKVTRDLTDRREAQLRLEETREQLFQAQKMEAIGQLTGGVAHDFNNLLTVILGSADLVEPHVRGDERLHRLIGNMRRAAVRGEALTKQLLAFSRRQPLRPEPIDLTAQMQGIVDLLSRSLRGDIAIVTDIDPETSPINVDPGQLELSILNIGLNARDAMPDGGTLTVTLRNEELKGRGVEPSGAFVAIGLTDTGTGMSEEVLARAFEPFFSTKGVGRGSGLGLSQAYGFARQSGGTLTIDSALGTGTTVTIHLPAAGRQEQAKPAPPAGPVPAPARARGDATVLLVEDDPAVAELGLGLLQGGGYKVRAVGTAAEALAVLRAGGEIDLVLSDVMMPGGMNGVQLAQVIRAEFPAVFILLATGYAEAAARSEAQEFPLIMKPYGRDTLLTKVAEIIG